LQEPGRTKGFGTKGLKGLEKRKTGFKPVKLIDNYIPSKNIPKPPVVRKGMLNIPFNVLTKKSMVQVRHNNQNS
jgi:hypothetical protein